jgi:elongation factor Ts
MADFTAKDVQALRQKTGAGMMDAKNALVETGGDMDGAEKLLREKGLAKAAGRTDRENTEGVVAVASSGDAAAMVLLKSETDFTAKAEQFVSLAQKIADAVAAGGPSAADEFASAVDDLKIVQKENIEIGSVVHVPTAGLVSDVYLHGNAKNGVIVVLDGGTEALAHDIALHAAFSRPRYVRREQVPEAEVAEEREVLLAQTKQEGKPEQAWDKIVEGKLAGWFRETVLLEQKWSRDEKQTITQLLGDATVVAFEQLEIG